MSGYTIGLIITGVIALIVATSILWGIKRGLKKTLFRFAWLLVTAAILLLTINPLSNWLNSFDLSSLNLDLGGEITKLSDIGENLLKSMGITDEVLADSPALASLAQNLPVMILNVILFVLVFWVAKAILWPLWAIISRAVFDKQARLEKKLKKESQKKQKDAKKSGIATPIEEALPQVLTVKQNKHRAWGAFFGLVMGLLVCAVTFSPIAGLNSIFQTAYNNITVEEDGKQVPYLSTVMDEQSLELVNSYETSIGSKILTYTGMNALSSTMFRGLATVEVDNQKVYLTDEVNTFVYLYKNIATLQSIDFENLTQQSIDKLLNTVEQIFVDSEGSKILYLLGDELIPHFVDEFLEQEDIEIIDGDVIDEIIINAYKGSVDFALREFKDEISAVVDLVRELNKSNLIAPVANEEVKTLEEFAVLVGTNIKDANGFATRVVDSVYKISMLEGEYANFAKAGIESLFKSLDIAYQEQEVSANSVKDGLKTLLKNGVSVCQSYAKAGGADFGDNTSLALSSVGAILDYLKTSIFSQQNYNNLIDYLKTTIEDSTKNFADFNTILNCLSNVTNWESELYSLSNLYSAVIKFSQANLTLDDVIGGNTTLIENIGKGLQSAINGGSKIINNQNIRTALEEILEANSLGSDIDEILEVEVDTGVSLKNHILNNIYSSGASSIADWQKEFRYNLDVVITVYKLVQDGFDLESLSQSTNTQLQEIGASIDTALQNRNTRLVLSHKVIRAVLEDLINNKANLDKEVSEILAFKDTKGISVLNNILNNIYNGSNGSVVFEQELKNIIKAVYDFSQLEISSIDKENITSIGAVLDDLSGSKIINKHVIATILSNYTDKLIETIDADTKTKIQSFVNGIKSNFENVDSFEIELGNLVDLLNLVEDEDVTLVEVGQKLDEVLLSSKLIVKENITALIEGLFDDFVSVANADLKTVIQGIKVNIANIESYETEFEHLDNLINCLDKTLPEIGAELDKVLDESNPSKLIEKENVTKIVEHFFDEAVEDLNLSAATDSGLINALSSIRENIANIVSYEEEFENLETLTNNINSSSLATIGESLNALISAGSTLITKENITSIVTHFFDEEITELNLDNVNDSGLISIINEIKSNISNIENYKTEFENLETLTSSLDNEDLSVVGQKLDALKGSNSKLITVENVEDIVSYFFEEESSAYKEGEFSSIISTMQSKIESASSYEDAFGELNDVVGYLEKFSNLETIDQYKAVNTDDALGKALDDMASMTSACDNTVAYDVATILLNNLKENNPTIETSVNNIINNSPHNFSDYGASGNYPEDADYYTTLINAVFNAI